MNRIIWLALIVASGALSPLPAVALLNDVSDDEVEVTVSSGSGKTYLKTSFGRLPDGELRPNCIEDKGIPLPIEFKHAWQVPVKRFPGGALSEVIDDEEVLFEPIDLAIGAQALDIGDLMISNGPMAGEWKFLLSTRLKNGLLIKWTQGDNHFIQTFIPWAGIYSRGIERSQFDAPLCLG